jgi:predicted transcriptional regulator
MPGTLTVLDSAFLQRAVDLIKKSERICVSLPRPFGRIRSWRLAAHQPLQQVWGVMNSRTLPCAPILDDDGRAQGVVHARDVAIALIDEVNYEEVLLRDYVMGVGYQ